MACIDRVLQLALLVEQRGHFIVAHRLCKTHADFVEAIEQCLDLADALFDVASHIKAFIELWLLRQIANIDAGLRACLAVKFLVLAGHNAQQG